LRATEPDGAALVPVGITVTTEREAFMFWLHSVAAVVPWMVCPVRSGATQPAPVPCLVWLRRLGAVQALMVPVAIRLILVPPVQPPQP
jgi:hypothetical protein